MSRRPSRRNRRGSGRHVQLAEWLQASEAWATLRPGPRALYVELKRRYNGANNGEIFLSHRDAAKALCVNRNTVTGYFAELQERGFIRMTQAPHLGPAGIGLASKWALEEDSTVDGKPGGMSFMRWREKQNPRQKIEHGRPKKQDGSAQETPCRAGSVLKFGTQSRQN